MGLNNKSTFLVISLDLSAAFDTVDHEILLSISFQIGIIGQAHSLIKSYLNGRTQGVLIDGSYSEDKSFEAGVPQGSILGPVLFILYLLPLRSLLKEYLASYHIYADDITNYLEFVLGTIFKTWKDNKCLKLLAALKLKVNSSKTQCMFVTNQRTCLPETISMDGIRIETRDSVKNLGAPLDNKLGFPSFINSTCAKQGCREIVETLGRDSRNANSRRESRNNSWRNRESRNDSKNEFAKSGEFFEHIRELKLKENSNQLPSVDHEYVESPSILSFAEINTEKADEQFDIIASLPNFRFVRWIIQFQVYMSIEWFLMIILGQQGVMLRGCFRQDDYSSHIFRAGCLLKTITEMCF